MTEVRTDFAVGQFFPRGLCGVVGRAIVNDDQFGLAGIVVQIVTIARNDLPRRAPSLYAGTTIDRECVIQTFRRIYHSRIDRTSAWLPTAAWTCRMLPRRSGRSCVPLLRMKSCCVNILLAVADVVPLESSVVMTRRFIIIASAIILIAAVVGGTIGRSRRFRHSVPANGAVSTNAGRRH